MTMPNLLAAHTDDQLRKLDTPEAKAELVRRGLLPCPESVKRSKARKWVKK